MHRNLSQNNISFIEHLILSLCLLLLPLQLRLGCCNVNCIPLQIKYNFTITISLHTSFADQRSGQCASEGAGMMTKLRRESKSYNFSKKVPKVTIASLILFFDLNRWSWQCKLFVDSLKLSLIWFGYCPLIGIMHQNLRWDSEHEIPKKCNEITKKLG